MYNKDTLNHISKNIKSVLYLYDSSAATLYSYNGNEEKTATTPQWIVALAESGVVRKIFQKDGKNYSCYCFKIDQNKYIVFQDNTEGEKLGAFIAVVLNLNENSQSPLIQSQDESLIKKEFIKIK